MSASVTIGGQTGAGRRSRGGRATVWLSCTALFVSGFANALLGPALPDLAARSGVPLGNAGAFFTGFFAAAMLSTVLAGRAIDRFGRRRPLVVGLALHGLALVLLPLAAAPLPYYALGALLGAGDGVMVVCVHVLVAEASPDDEASALNVLNVFFGVGAVVGPALAALTRTRGGEQVLLFAAAGALQFAVMVLSWRMLRGVSGERRGASGEDTSHDTGRDAGHSPLAPRRSLLTAQRASILRSSLLWLLAALLLVYVGVEVGLGAWAFTYARAAAGLSASAAALLSSGYWLALTLGRLLSPLALRYIRPVTLLAGGAVASAVATGLLVVLGEIPAALVLGVLVAGLGFGPVWPVAFALAARAFPHAAGSAAGMLGMVSAAGGLVLPWLQGRVLVAAGPSAGISVTFISCLALAALAVAVRRSPRIA